VWCIIMNIIKKELEKAKIQHSASIGGGLIGNASEQKARICYILSRKGLDV
jgi:hypothetical protein